MLNRYSVRLYEEIPDYLMPQFMSNFSLNKRGAFEIFTWKLRKNKKDYKIKIWWEFLNEFEKETCKQ